MPSTEAERCHHCVSPAKDQGTHVLVVQRSHRGGRRVGPRKLHVLHTAGAAGMK